MQVFTELFNFSFFSTTGWDIDLDYWDTEWFALETNRDFSVIFETAPKYCISDSFAEYEGYSISSKRFLPTVVDTMVIWIKFAHFSPFWFTDSQNFDVHSCHLLLDHVQFIWFMDLTFLVPMQYCSLQHQTLLSSQVTSTTGHYFCFGSHSSFFLDLFLHSSPVAYWAPTDLGSSSFSVICFCLFVLFMGFSRQEYWSGLLFSSPVDHVLLELFNHESSVLGGPTWHGS